MNTDTQMGHRYEISPRFRLSVEERIQRLERDAETDEAMLAGLTNEDHIRRHTRLIWVQRAEASRMRLFLDRAGARRENASLV